MLLNEIFSFPSYQNSVLFYHKKFWVAIEICHEGCRWLFIYSRFIEKQLRAHRADGMIKLFQCSEGTLDYTEKRLRFTQ